MRTTKETIKQDKIIYNLLNNKIAKPIKQETRNNIRDQNENQIKHIKCEPLDKPKLRHRNFAHSMRKMRDGYPPPTSYLPYLTAIVLPSPLLQPCGLQTQPAASIQLKIIEFNNLVAAILFSRFSFQILNQISSK